MKWILPLLTASSVVSTSIVVAAAPQLNMNEEAPTLQYVYQEPRPIEQLDFVQQLETLAAEMEAAAIAKAEREAELRKLAAEVAAAERQRLVDEANYQKLLSAIEKTKSYVGKTWYVFAGSSPQGWDCSGLVRWTYLQVDIELPHSATDQLYSGVFVDEPKLGDIVTFSFNGTTAGHAGIYLSEDTMLHSGGKRGDKTGIKSISEFGKPYSKIFYTRVIGTEEPRFDISSVLW